jgi:CBS domain-containing protein/YHS domain-containing protein
MQVRDIMTKAPVCCGPDLPLADVARLMVQFDCGGIPIVEPEARRPVGLITDRDITCRTIAAGKNPLDLIASDCMSAPVVTVTPDTSVEECCHAMEAHQIRRVPVVDAGGSCCGIVSQADLALRMANGRSADVVREISRHIEKTDVGSDWATDPVCGMRVHRSMAPARTTFHSETYYFCSERCLNKFNKDADDYVAPA